MSRSNALPEPDEALARLHSSGWTVGEAAFGLMWLVTGSKGENLTRAEGQTQAEAWQRACLQAEAVGMLGENGFREWRASGFC